MTKLYFNFAIKVQQPKRRKSTSSSFKKISKLVEGVVFIEDGVYKVKKVINGSESLILEFTPQSYSLKNRTEVFFKVNSNEEKRTRVIRTKETALVHPGNPNTYIPFAPHWRVSGYIVKNKDGDMMFEFNDLILPEGYIDIENR